VGGSWRAIHQYKTAADCLLKGLAEGLPSLVHGGATKYEVRCLELPIHMNEYFKPEHEIQVPDMHYSKIQSKYSTVYNKEI